MMSTNGEKVIYTFTMIGCFFCFFANIEKLTKLPAQLAPDLISEQMQFVCFGFYFILL